MLTELDLKMLKTGMTFCVELADLERQGDTFIMTGPSGTHRLDVHMTNLERLNAHWAGFCADTRNHFKSPVVL
jgi:hypothetical protein